MSYRLTYAVTVNYVGDGTGPMEVPGSPILTLFGAAQPDAPTQGPVSGVIVVPGGNAPSLANFTTAFTAMAADLTAQVTVPALLARLQAFATGGN